MKVRPYRFLTLIIFVCFSKTYAQTITVDSFKTEISENNLIELFDQNIKDRSDLYNGPAYEAPEKAYKGSVFFNNLNYFVPCNIRYNGYLYKNIPLLYDVFKNVFVSSSPAGFNFILFGTKVEYINLSGHHFIYLDSQKAAGLEEGYYDELYKGATSVIVKRIKKISNNVTEQAVEITYTDESETYIKHNGRYFAANSKSELMEILKDKKNELSQFFKSNKVKFNKDKEASVVVLAKFYDQISN